MKDNSEISQELLEIIERYINGSMTIQELKDFNQLLELDKEFKTKVKDVETMLKGIEAQTLKEQLDEFHEAIPQTIIKKPIRGKVRFLNFSKIAVAAALVLAIGGIWFFSSPKNEKLYTNYFKPDPGLPTTMGSTNNFAFYDAMVNYKHGDYNIAIDKWKVLQEKKPENDTLNYFLGVAHLANKNINDAIPFLERSIEAEDGFIFLDEAYLYLGLAYLKEGNVELAKKHLDLSETDTAKAIIAKLKP
ncbi:tetratricopeptide repeat protein [uncultured Algibacter sp.]|uniref:tetratricopeptide repeat protein n=1 Tax=uncultured Algibacter sp. TaxID=298659 RepID=UPI00261876E2|nr:tetratricopeptide repeat protein [uncultured Algibacter sp.]